MEFYLRNATRQFFYGEPKPADGSSLVGKVTFRFIDPDRREKGYHSVVAFVLPPRVGTEELEDELWGPFGWESQTGREGFRLYSRKGWGPANKRQIAANPALLKLSREIYPHAVILLAGVRLGWIFLLWRAKDFRLVWKPTDSRS